MESTQQSARVEVSAPARAALRVLVVGVLFTSVPASRPLQLAVQSVASRPADALRVRPPPSRLVQVIGGSVTVPVALPFLSPSSDIRLKKVAA